MPTTTTTANNDGIATTKVGGLPATKVDNANFDCAKNAERDENRQSALLVIIRSRIGARRVCRTCSLVQTWWRI